MVFEYLSFLIEVSDVIFAISCLANFHLHQFNALRQGADECSATVKLFTSVPDLVVNVFSANNSFENSVN